MKNFLIFFISVLAIIGWYLPKESLRLAGTVIPVFTGGTGSSSFSPSTLISVNSTGTALVSTSSPTVSWITATSTTVSSVFNNVLIKTDSSGNTRTIKVEDQTNSNIDGSELDIIGANGQGSGQGGSYYIQAGTGGATGNGGSIQYVGGTGGLTSGNGGDIMFLPGTIVGGGTTGKLKFRSPVSFQYGIFNFDSITSTDKTFTFPNQTGTVCVTSVNCVEIFSGLAGIGTTSPYLRLSVAGDVVFGHITSTSTKPTLSLSGTGGSLDARSSDTAGLVYLGRSSSAGVITFSRPFTSPPVCVTSGASTTDAFRATSTISQLAIMSTTTSVGGATLGVNYHCIQGN